MLRGHFWRMTLPNENGGDHSHGAPLSVSLFNPFALRDGARPALRATLGNLLCFLVCYRVKVRHRIPTLRTLGLVVVVRVVQGSAVDASVLSEQRSTPISSEASCSMVRARCTYVPELRTRS